MVKREISFIKQLFLYGCSSNIHLIIAWHVAHSAGYKADVADKSEILHYTVHDLRLQQT